MADYISGFTGANFDKSIQSGSGYQGFVTASEARIDGNLEIAGNVSGSATSNLSVGGNITGSGNLEIAGNVSGSGTSTGSFAYINITNLPTSDPAVAGAFFTTGSTTMGLGDITGSGWQVVAVSQGS